MSVVRDIDKRKIQLKQSSCTIKFLKFQPITVQLHILYQSGQRWEKIGSDISDQSWLYSSNFCSISKISSPVIRFGYWERFFLESKCKIKIIFNSTSHSYMQLMQIWHGSLPNVQRNLSMILAIGLMLRKTKFLHHPHFSEVIMSSSSLEWSP